MLAWSFYARCQRQQIIHCEPASFDDGYSANQRLAHGERAGFVDDEGVDFRERFEGFRVADEHSDVRATAGALAEAAAKLPPDSWPNLVIWTTGEHNEGSQRFYDRLGMRQEKKVYYVMDV